MRHIRTDPQRMDAQAAPKQGVRDEVLREQVDWLPELEQHMVSRVYFGGATVVEAAEEAGVSLADGKKAVKNGIELLRQDLAYAPDAGGPRVPKAKKERVRRCRRKTEWGQCMQAAHDDDTMCTIHRYFWVTGKRPDRYWHEKVAKGLIVPTVDWMTESEMEAVINGRYRGDGRRIDQYVAGDPLMLDMEAFL